MTRISQSIAFLFVCLCCEVFECHVVRTASYHFRASRSAGDAGTHEEGTTTVKPEVASKNLLDPDVIITKPKVPEKDVLAEHLPTGWPPVRVQHGTLGAADKRAAESKYPIIAACHYKLELVFGRHAEAWTGDWKIWVGFTLWIVVGTKWVRSGFVETFLERACFAFGINIMILHHLQYSQSIRMGMMQINNLLTVQTVFQNYLQAKADHRTWSEIKELTCDTLYLDLALPFAQIFVLFCAQVSLWWFYMTSILFNFNFNNVNYVFWLVAYLAMQMTMIFNRGSDSVLGNPYPVHDVIAMTQLPGKTTFILKDLDDAAAPHKPQHHSFNLSKVDLLTRGCMGFLCNAILRDIMSYTIPLMLMGFSEPMDFVVYCVGVNFICCVDDMSEKTYVMQDTPESVRDSQESVREPQPGDDIPWSGY